MRPHPTPRLMKIDKGQLNVIHAISQGLMQRNSRPTKNASNRRSTIIISVAKDDAITHDGAYAAARLPSWNTSINENRRGPAPKSVDCIFAINGRIRGLYKTHALLKAKMDCTPFTDKAILHQNMMKIAPHTIAATVEVGSATILPPGAVWILRANWGSSGKLSAVVSTNEELRETYASFSTTSGNIPRGIRPVILGSEYIRDPMLWRGFKFHTRVICIVVVHRSGRRYAAMLPSVKMILSGAPYVDGDYGNVEIHDSHFRRNALRGYLPGSITDDDVAAMGFTGQELHDKIHSCLQDSIKPLLPSLTLYPKEEVELAGYNIVGADVMFRSDGTPILIEVNDSPSINERVPGAPTTLYQECIDAVFATVFHDIFHTTLTPRESALKKEMRFL